MRAAVEQIKVRALIVAEHPRKDGVLRQVVERAARERVELNQIVEIGDKALAPRLAELREPLAARGRVARAAVRQISEVADKEGKKVSDEREQE